MLRKNYAATGSFLPEDRGRAVDLLGFESQLMFNTFHNRRLFDWEHGDDMEFAYGAARAHNRGMVEFCSADPRLLPTCYVPLVDFDRAAAMAEESVELGASALPQSFDVWFARCVDRDPTRRYPDARAASWPALVRGPCEVKMVKKPPSAPPSIIRGRSTWLPSLSTSCRSVMVQPGRENSDGVSKWVSSTMAASCAALACGDTFTPPTGWANAAVADSAAAPVPESL